MNRLLSNRSFLFRSLTPMLLVSALGLAGAAVAADKAKAPLRRLPAPEKVTPAARAAIHERMAQHSNTMSNLVKAVILLDRSTITTLAGRIADEEVVARVEDAEGRKRDALLPKAFLAEQDQLKKAARELAVAADQREADTALADRFATLTRTCVTCHGAYLGWRVDGLP